MARYRMYPKADFLRPEFQQYDAVSKFDITIPEASTMPPGCLCTQVLLGKAPPSECPHFAKGCTPTHPIGPCMVSHEGTCKIQFMFRESSQ